MSGVTAIATNLEHSVALLHDGSVMSWGDNAFGQLGDDTTTSSTTPVAVTGLSAAIAIAAGADHSLAIAPPPANNFRINPLLFCRFCQFVTLKINLPDPGLLTAMQLSRLAHASLVSASNKNQKPLIKSLSVRVTKAGTVTLRLKLTAAGKKALKRKGKLRVKVLITFTPTGGTPASRTLTLTYRERKKHHH